MDDMESKEFRADLYHLWVQYRSKGQKAELWSPILTCIRRNKNEDKYFRSFIHEFVAHWRSQLGLDAVHSRDDIGHMRGPNLFRLPEEFLPTVSKYFHKDILRLEKKYVRVGEYNEGLRQASMQCLVAGCRLLQSLYDPYGFWEKRVKRSCHMESHNLDFQAASLHVQLVPFLYDSLEGPSAVIEEEEAAIELLNILGAILCGSKVNAIRVTCPASLDILQTVLSWPSVTPKTQIPAVYCFAAMAHSILTSAPNERQMEIGTLLERYQACILSLAININTNPDQVSTLILAVESVAHMMEVHSSEARNALQEAVFRVGILETLVDILKDSKAVNLPGNASTAARSISCGIFSHSFVRTRFRDSTLS
ncbi:unnamed protein product [Darwinula stevensoni]|uniref:ARM repeat superfamily protein n=1 Tax=Darwinula stevensoni TaxID=69355 RepID=A0A7R9FPS4_9CRUS|nr:unnamed protein product [Darwinula stevensoni]CAG0898366.1 unnamed protein product [Darwinula stevensoni]